MMMGPVSPPSEIRAWRVASALTLSMCAFACGSSHDNNGSSGTGSTGSGGSAGNVGIILPQGGGSPIVNGGAGNTGPYQLPAGFTKTEFGGYKLGAAFNGDAPPGVSAGGSSGDSCGSTILGVVRDFKGVNEAGGHPDFEAFSGRGPTLGLVPPDLGADSKPGYTGICEANATRQNCRYGQQTTSKAYFDEWYRYTADVNKPYVVYFSLQPNNGILTFQSDLFFPLDNAGWGNSGTAQDNQQHNFGFTTEVHTQFKYNGGEKFTFIGDDDVWVFVNKKLAVDLGGLHPSATGSVTLDTQATALGISVGNAYPLDLFHAERHTNASHFRIDTNLQFTNCGVIVPEPPIK